MYPDPSSNVLLLLLLASARILPLHGRPHGHFRLAFAPDHRVPVHVRLRSGSVGQA